MDDCLAHETAGKGRSHQPTATSSGPRPRKHRTVPIQSNNLHQRCLDDCASGPRMAPAVPSPRQLTASGPRHSDLAHPRQPLAAIHKTHFQISRSPPTPATSEPRALRRPPPEASGTSGRRGKMQSAAAIGLVRPCAARSLGVRPRPRGLGPSVAAALPRAAGLTAAGRRVGLVPASPLEDKRPVVAAAAADGAAGGEEGSGGLVKTLQLGSLFGLWYLFNIYFNIYNKQVSSQCTRTLDLFSFA
jgi:hypothetical protein